MRKKLWHAGTPGCQGADAAQGIRTRHLTRPGDLDAAQTAAVFSARIDHRLWPGRSRNLASAYLVDFDFQRGFLTHVTFIDTTFGGSTWFDEVTFCGDARFARAAFDGDVSFDVATFAGEAMLGKATFGEEPGLAGQPSPRPAGVSIEARGYETSRILTFLLVDGRTHGGSKCQGADLAETLNGTTKQYWATTGVGCATRGGGCARLTLDVQ